MSGLTNYLYGFFKSAHTSRTFDRLMKVAKSQDEFGHQKYGKYLDPEDDYDWIAMAEEELADLMKYLHAAREARDIENIKLYKRIVVSQNLVKDALSGKMDKEDVLKALERELVNMRSMLDERAKLGTTKS